MLRTALLSTIESLISDYENIPAVRKEALSILVRYIKDKAKADQAIDLNFICTHNSRRSHFAQMWAQAAAYYYEVGQVKTFSGGVETTAFNGRSVKALQQVGFDIEKINESSNPIYRVRFATDADLITAFSKIYDDPFNQSDDFAAIMTCSHADENCPIISGASARISLTYDDPKEFDDSPFEEEKYRECVLQIGREMLFVFSQV